MPRQIELEIDVSGAPGVPGAAVVCMTVHIPPRVLIGDTPVVCFARPGGGFSRGYFSQALPGCNLPSQGDWHAERGWIFVALDPLGVGSSRTDIPPAALDYTVVTAAAHAAEQEVLARLADGSLDGSLPSLTDTVVIGMGQSMGGSLAIVQQGRYHRWQGIAVLGFGAIHTHPAAVGMPALRMPWRAREQLPEGVPQVLNAEAPAAVSRQAMAAVNRKLFFHDDLGEVLIDELLTHAEPGQLPRPWAPLTSPLGVISRCLTPGIVAPEAAAIDVPVLVALGERDVVADPKGEPRAYLSARSVDLFICPRMGHMHNFATSRELFWQRIENWGAWVRVQFLSGRATP